jgi:hypothetical protein
MPNVNGTPSAYAAQELAKRQSSQSDAGYWKQTHSFFWNLFKIDFTAIQNRNAVADCPFRAIAGDFLQNMLSRE